MKQHITFLLCIITLLHTQTHAQEIAQEAINTTVKKSSEQLSDSFMSRLFGGPHEGLKIMGLEMLVYMGEGMALGLFTQDDAQEQMALIKKIQDMRTKLAATEKTLAANTKTNLDTLVKNFSASLTDIQNQNQQTHITNDILYIQRLVNISKAQSNFLPDQQSNIANDNLFSTSTMLTPQNAAGSVWHNPLRMGNWLYDAQQNGFIQHISTPPVGTTITSAYAGLNQIFTELYTDQKTYSIQLELTIISAEFPFCSGLLFNKARWLPGNLDRMYTHRFAGFYGYLDANNTRQVSFYVGQTGSGSVALSPATMLYDKPDNNSDPNQPKRLYTLSDSDSKQIGLEPLTYRITVTTEQSQVTVKLEQKQSNGNFTELNLSQTIIEFSDIAQNQLMFWYHNIGFLSPSCQTLFKLIEQTGQNNINNPINTLIFTPKS